MSDVDQDPPVAGPGQESEDRTLLIAGLDHSWKWVEICTNRQAQSFNFFLVLSAFLVAAYISAIGSRLLVAGLVAAAAGVLAAIGFGIQDRWIKRYIDVGERALTVLEERLGRIIDCPELQMLDAVGAGGAKRTSLAIAGYAAAAPVWIVAAAYGLIQAG